MLKWGLLGGMVALLLSGCSSEPKPYGGMVGVVEGFYGTPWSHQDRIDMLDFMGARKLNTYIYAPKADSFRSWNWRSPYPRESAERFRELLQRAKRNQVRFYFAISPGISLEYSEDGELALLREKINQMSALGVEHFALLFDEIPPRLSPKDGLVFDGLASAQALLVNQTYEYLKPRGSALAICPIVFTDAWQNHAYVKELGEKVHPEVPFFWTGTDVVVDRVTGQEAEEWTELTGRRPILWDNYPVNDFQSWRLFLKGYSGRDSALGSRLDGLVLNPMNQAHASMIPLSTLSDFVAGEPSYDPRSSARKAAVSLFGSEAALHVEPFLEAYGNDPLEPSIFSPLFVPTNRIEVEVIRKEFERLDRALRTLKGPEFSGNAMVKAFISEVDPLLTRTHNQLTELEESDEYAREGATLIYADGPDQFTAQRSTLPIEIDGDLKEWADASWTEMKSHASDSFDSRAEVALRHSSQHIYIAIRVTDFHISSKPGIWVGEGDHVGLVIGRESGAAPSPRSDFILIPSNTGDTAVFHGQYTAKGFLQRALLEVEDLALDPFSATMLELPPSQRVPGVQAASRGLPSGWNTEVQVEKEADRSSMRLSLYVVDQDQEGTRYYSLSTRNFPLNAETHATIHY